MDFLFYFLGQILKVFINPACLKYMVLLAILGLIALPLSHRLFHKGRLAWFAASGILGLSTLNYGAWLIGHCGIPYSGWTLYALLIPAAIASVWGYRRNWAEISARLRLGRRPIAVGILVFLLAFSFGAVLRMHAPDVRDQEKFMDMAFLNSLQSNTVIPPADPWRFDLPINYYYGGYMQMATMAKMTATPPEFSYNISVALIFALTCLLSYILVFELTRRVRWAFLAVCTVVLMGNLDVVVQNLAYLRDMDPNKHFAVDWWHPSRVITDGPSPDVQEATITEFPFFSFFHADLHPHVMAIPYVLLFLSMLLNLFQTRASGIAGFGFGRWRWIRFAFTAWALGSLAMINGFDYITFSFVLGVSIALAEWRSAHRWNDRIGFKTLRMLMVWLSVLFLAFSFFSPFFLNYHAPVTGKPFHYADSSQSFITALANHIRNDLPVGFVDFRSGIGEFLTMWETQLFVLVAFLILFTGRIRKLLPRNFSFIYWPVFLFAWALFYRWWGHLVVSFLPLLAFWIIAVFAFSRKTPARMFAFTAMLASIIILFGCEQFYIRDNYGQNLQRMNTLFKFYYPVWIMLGLCLPYLLQEIIRSRSSFGRKQWILAGVAFLLISWSMEYPLYTTWNRIAHYNREQFGSASLNGMKWMEREHPADYRAILWLRENARRLSRTSKGRISDDSRVPVVLEAVGGSYTYYARVSTYAGIRSVLGWSGHQSVWRGEWPSEVENDVRSIYSNPSLDAVLPLLKKYSVDFIYIGEQERLAYPSSGIDKFAKVFPKVYDDSSGGVGIYQVHQSKG